MNEKNWLRTLQQSVPIDELRSLRLLTVLGRLIKWIRSALGPSLGRDVQLPCLRMKSCSLFPWCDSSNTSPCPFIKINLSIDSHEKPKPAASFWPTTCLLHFEITKRFFSKARWRTVCKLFFSKWAFIICRSWSPFASNKILQASFVNSVGMIMQLNLSPALRRFGGKEPTWSNL